MARLRRFLMLEKARDGRAEAEGGGPAPALSARFGAVAPPAAEAEAPPAADRFAPPPDPDLVLEVEARERPEPSRGDGALAAEIERMAVRREQIGLAPVEPHHPRQIDRLAALVAVGPLAAWSPRARVLLVAGIGAAAIAALFFAGGIGPRVLQAALALLLFALFVRS